MKDQAEVQETNDDDVIAIIGMSCRFPDARNPEEFWRNLRAGHASVREFSDDDLRRAGGDPANRARSNFVSRGIVLDGIDRFDAPFFGFNPRDAEILDPQQRIFLECAWEALEDAGYDPSRGESLIGVFGGADLSSYLLNLYSNREIMAAVGHFAVNLANDKDHLTTRVAYELNLKGPAVTIQTTCSTSLVAVCAACQSLLHYQCDIALAGGSAIWVSQGSGYFWEEGGISSPDACCRAFDADARGTVSGSGAGIVVLKRYGEARADGDNIYALIRGFGLSNDGSDKIGYTAPSVEGQAQAIRTALLMAGVNPDTISYIECHGTATPLGDPIEVAALTQVFRAQTGHEQFCGIGSVKTNIGHLNSAAGVAGLIKTVLALQHKMLPPSLNYRRPNPNIDFRNSPFFVVDFLRAWDAGTTPRRAGVSSFGLGGTNAHVVLEEAPSVSGCSHGREWQVLPLSAKTATALEGMTRNLGDYLRNRPDADLADIAYTLQVGRQAFAYRRVTITTRSDSAGAIEALENENPGRLISGAGGGRPSVVFMFPGQGAQHAGMGGALYGSEPVFREQVDRACDMLRSVLDSDLRDVLYSNSRQTSPWPTAIAQPALFVIEYALARLWMDWGVMPRTMVGHSVGEYVAACLAGVFSVQDALRLVATRGRLMQSMPPGAMLAVSLNESEAVEFVDHGVFLAAVNCPAVCVLSGAVEAVERLEAELTKRSVRYQRLHTSHAFHSAMMDPIINDFVDQVRQINLQPPSLPYLSNLTGTWITAGQATDPSYWGQHLRQTVRFAQNLRVLQKNSQQAYLEVGPGCQLATLARHCLHGDGFLVLATLPHPQDQAPPLKMVNQTLGALWAYGIDINWRAVHRGERRRRVSLPTYPFERQSYWIATPPRGEGAVEQAAADLAGWFYLPSWKPALALPGSQNGQFAHTKASWLVFVDDMGLGLQLVSRLGDRGQNFTAVLPGDRFTRIDDHWFTVRPAQRDDYEALLKELRKANGIPDKVLHLWSVTAEEAAESNETYQARGFYSIVSLAQALAKLNITGPTEIGVVCNGLQAVLGDEPISPLKATVLGPCKVIPQEYPNIRCRSVDVVLGGDAKSHERLVDRLIAELMVQPFDAVVAYRQSRRWIQSFERLRLDPVDGSPTRLRRNGVYLITGGLGNIGLTLAEYLAREVQAKLVLCGRSAFPERPQWQEWLANHADDGISRKIRRLIALEETGAEVAVYSADCSDRDRMREIIERTCERFGAINGVVHGAGNTSVEAFTAVSNAERTACEAHFTPKVRGMIVLEELLRDKELDFYLLLSSLSSVLGGLGFVAYSAANSFLDAFAVRQNQGESTPWISVNWDAWQFADQAKLEVASVTQFIRPEDGIEAVRRILDKAPPQVAVSTSDLQARLDQWIRLESVRETGQSRTKEVVRHHKRPKLSSQYVESRNPAEQTIVAIWQELLGVSPIGIYDNFFELGGHSLLAVQLISRLRELFRVEITVGALFETPTVSGIAQALRRVETIAGQVDAIAELRRQMDRMSPEALHEWLSKEEQSASSPGTH